MILYYSATGNSKHVAHRLGQALNQEPIDICTVKSKLVNCANQDLYFVTFNCFWGVSDRVKSFLLEREFKNIRKIIFVLTCGGFLGGVDRQLEEICGHKHLDKPIIYGINMVTNYSILHDIPNPKIQKRKLKQAESIIDKIIGGQAKVYRSFFLLKYLQPYIYSQYQKYRTTAPFWVSDACISCGLCARNCPLGAIQMVAGKPKWLKPQCDNCLKCLNLCPGQAINYGQSTVKRARYSYGQEGRQ